VGLSQCESSRLFTVKAGVDLAWQSWPPHIYIILEALAGVPKNVTTLPLPQINAITSSYNFIPDGQLGLSEDQLPKYVPSLAPYLPFLM
jgi:hypothetical protein